MRKLLGEAFFFIQQLSVECQPTVRSLAGEHGGGGEPSGRKMHERLPSQGGDC